MADTPQDQMWARVIDVLSFVSRGRGYLGCEIYPDSTARRALAELNEWLAATKAPFLPLPEVVEITDPALANRIARNGAMSGVGHPRMFLRTRGNGGRVARPRVRLGAGTTSTATQPKRFDLRWCQTRRLQSCARRNTSASAT
jgi:hypothetical protein